jgi:two-component system cell cycle sensor histidine kinase/response regulator CckA
VIVMPEDSQPTILVIDDDSQVRGLIVRALTGAGYDVLEARGGVEGVGVFETHKNVIKLVVLDLVMPGQGGLDVANELTRIEPQVRTLYISGYGNSVVAHSIRLEQPSLLIMKPFSPSALLERIRTLLDDEIAKSA